MHGQPNIKIYVTTVNSTWSVLIKYAKGQCMLNKNKGFIEINVNDMYFAMRIYRVTKFEDMAEDWI